MSAGRTARHTGGNTMLNLIALAIFSAAVTAPMLVLTLRRPLVEAA
ncbi:hypothetical protein [Terriglobus aquaticus]|uniref:Uncharacterized protein n=1 Tax=Terriglobus aquaticus TaxID=940139 RepID=A0ABW9KP13_9BACT